MRISAGKWLVTVSAPPEASVFTASDDVDARLIVVRNWVRDHGGAVMEETGAWTSSDVEVSFTLTRSATWSHAWATPVEDRSFLEEAQDRYRESVDYTTEQARETVDYADTAAQSKLDAADALAQERIAEADVAAEVRIKQNQNKMILAGIAVVTIAAVAYITVSPSQG